MIAHTTTNSSYRHSSAFRSLSVVDQRRHQIMAPLLPNVMRKPRAIRLAFTVVGSLTWEVEIRGVEK